MVVWPFLCLQRLGRIPVRVQGWLAGGETGRTRVVPVVVDVVVGLAVGVVLVGSCRARIARTEAGLGFGHFGSSQGRRAGFGVGRVHHLDHTARPWPTAASKAFHKTVY